MHDRQHTDQKMVKEAMLFLISDIVVLYINGFIFSPKIL